MHKRHRLRVIRVGLLAATLSGAYAFGQTDFSGEWPIVRSQDNIDNPHLGEYVGIPLSREAIRRAKFGMRRFNRCPSGNAVRTRACTSSAVRRI